MMEKINRLLLIIFTILFSFILRLIFNGTVSFSIDEMISLHLIRAPALDSLYFNHPPLFYWLLKAWTFLTPASETFYRSINAIFSVAATAGMGLIGYKHYGVRSGLTLMLLHAVAPISIVHSQLLLNYSLFEVLAVFQIYFYLSYVNKNTHRNHTLIFSILLLLTNYLSLILIFFEWAFLHRKKINFEKIPVILLFLIIALPIVFDIIDFKSMVWQKIEYHSNDLSFLPTNLIKVFLFISPISIATILFIILNYFYFHFSRYKEYINIFLAGIIFCIGVSAYTERFIFAPRYFVFFLPFFLILIERIISSLSSTPRKSIFGNLAIFLIWSGGVYEYFHYMPIKAPNWASAGQQIGGQDNTLIVTTLPEYIKYPYFDQYNPGVVQCTSVDQLVKTITSHNDGPIWLIDIYVNFISYQKELLGILNKLGYTYTDFSIQSPNLDPIFLFQIQKDSKIKK